MAGSSSKTRRPQPPALQKNLSRRVSFNEATLTNKGQGRHPPPPPSVESIESQTSDGSGDGGGRRRRRGCLSLCSSCCAWTSIIAAVLLTLFFLLGGIYFAFLQSNLPEVRLQRLDVGEIDIDGDTVVSSDFKIHLNATNGSGKIALRYSGLTATMSSAGVEFDHLKLADMYQEPHTTTEIIVHWVSKKLVVEEAAAKDLQDNAMKRLLVIDVVVKGHIDFLFGGKRMNGMPFKIDCHNIDQTEIDDGHAPKCNTQLSPLRDPSKMGSQLPSNLGGN